MIKENVGIKTGKRMGHISMQGEEGSIEAFQSLKTLNLVVQNVAPMHNCQGLEAMEASGKLAEINAKFFSPDFAVTYDDIAECDENIPEEYLPEDCEV